MCIPPELHGAVVERRGQWTLYHPRVTGGDLLYFLEHSGVRHATDETELLALREQIPHTILNEEVRGFGVGLCGAELSTMSGFACFIAYLSPETREPFVVADRIDTHLGLKHRDMCFGVVLELAKPIKISD